jgi:8-oxo-dGTP diphosphatase
VLLLHRRKSPNAGMYSPIGGKLHVNEGEGPHECARREIHEEAGVDVPPGDLRLSGIVSECAYEGQTHWLLFLFEVTRPIDPSEIASYDISEGTLEWVPPPEVDKLDIPETDRRFMWPNVQAHRGGFFMVHIDCKMQPMSWTVVESVKAVGADAR